MENMISEIIDAIKEKYEHNEETLVDCLLYLQPLDVIICDDEIRRLGYCPDCGEKLQEFTWREYHPEVDTPPRFEEMSDLVCPTCDFS